MGSIARTNRVFHVQAIFERLIKHQASASFHKLAVYDMPCIENMDASAVLNGFRDQPAGLQHIAALCLPDFGVKLVDCFKISVKQHKNPPHILFNQFLPLPAGLAIRLPAAVSLYGLQFAWRTGADFRVTK